MATEYALIEHPQSGQTYACELDAASGRIQRAVGPLDLDQHCYPPESYEYDEETGEWLDVAYADAPYRIHNASYCSGCGDGE